MGITGNLRTMELAELFQWLSQARKTGTLVVRNAAVEKRVVFQDGRILTSSSTDPNEYLGHFLVNHGYLTELELTRAMQMQESSRMLLGKILVTLGVISEEDLHRMLRLKCEESLYELFTWPEGEFRFLDGELPAQALVPLSLDVTAVVFEGMQRVDEWRRLRELIPDADALPVLVAPLDETVNDPATRQVLALVDDQRTVAEIATALHAAEFFVCRHLRPQILAGRVKIIRPRRIVMKAAPSAAPPAAAPAAAPAAPPAPPVPDADALAGAASRYLAAHDLESSLRYLRAARSLEPESRKLEALAQKIEEGVRATVEAAGVVSGAIPILARSLEELSRERLSPQEGFLLTRLDGSYDVHSLLNISALPALDTLVQIWKLLRAGHIKMQEL
ncbi:MAG: DUF4388 domain-containing protein [Acidobacteria bacterium]|nr:DUF4388 domain-containing protein [Acidobacteriota bacterium]NLN10957.1 DUF4388 domain-containing protein [Acidobacteriota bacterium]